MSSHYDTLIQNVSAYTAGPAGVIKDAVVAVRDGRIAWLGERSTHSMSADTTIDGNGQWLLPGLVDCHTHLVFGGQRAGEFQARLAGASYADIANAGGGIVSTVKATRAAPEPALLDAAKRRAIALLRDGVTTLEIKSGYGLTTDSEAKMLRVARQLGEQLPLSVVTSFLGAHALPAELAARRDDYVDLVCNEMLPALAAEQLVDAVDGFCEAIAFTPAEIERVFNAAKALGLPVKLHAEQLSDSGGAALAARYGALSADHLEHLSPEGVHAMATSGTVAVLLPGAFYFLRETRQPPVALLREAGVPMAVATDANPGSSPLLSLRLAANMACQLFGLTVDEALHSVTVHAARALGLESSCGSIDIGKRADFALCAIDEPAEFVYWMGGGVVTRLFKNGRAVDIDAL